MPIIQNSTYTAPHVFKNRHLNTIYPALLRRVPDVDYQRETIDTPDDDFLDLDWSKVGDNKVVIVSHGLEGDASRAYVKGMIRAFNRQGWDGIGSNFRGCTRPNRQLRSYHMGASDDLGLVVQHVLNLNHYEEIALIGFSLGGNVTLKYVGEQGTNISPIVKKAVAFSVPCHIKSANVEINKFHNRLYLKRFLVSLNAKVEAKRPHFEELQAIQPLRQPKNFVEFDDVYTGPLHGFKDALDYWERTSSKQFLPNIAIPTLLVNAQDDSFLSAACFPIQEAKENPNFYLEMPKHGGHVGFSGGAGDWWTERRAVEFVLGN